MTQSRVPGGVPRGGQFSATSRPEADVDLLDRPASVAQDEIGPEELFTQASASGRYWGGRFGVDAEDITQETLLAYLVSRSNKTNAHAVSNGAAAANGEHGDGETLGGVTNVGGYLHTTARSIALKRMTGLERSEDRAAYKRYASARADVEQELHRPLTKTEEDALAEKIRSEMPSRRRAGAGFHRQPQVISTDVLEHPDWIIYRAVGGGEPNVANKAEFAAASAGEVASRLIDSGGRSNFVAARRLAWDAVADAVHAPAVAQSTISERSATATRKYMSAQGGAGEVARRWANGEATAEEEKALFAPFGGGLSMSEQIGVVRTLRANPAYADDLWGAAMFAATNVRGGN
jgi:hypothetical protein